MREQKEIQKKSSKLKKAAYFAVGALAFILLISAGRQLPYIGNRNGFDTANVSGAMRATRAFIVRDTFTTKPGDYLQLWRNSSKLTYIDSAGRIYTPELLIGTTTRDATNALIVNGRTSTGTHGSYNTIKGSLNFDNASNAAYIMQNGSTVRSIYIPGTGGNGDFIINNSAGNGVQVVNSSAQSNYVNIRPGTNASSSPPHIRFNITGYSLPLRTISGIASSTSDVNIVIGTGDSVYANEVGYNVKVLAGRGGTTGNKTGGHVYLTPGLGGGSGIAGSVIISYCPEYADNAAAISAGLPTGAVYRTGDNLKIVH